jgi:hypothetical protein
MATLPPDVIQVKRKRGTDDGPVDFLRVCLRLSSPDSPGPLTVRR